MKPLSTETAVRQRYAAGAHEREEQLCCPVDYNPQYLQIIPQEVIERDYGCGDPPVRRGLPRAIHTKCRRQILMFGA